MMEKVTAGRDELGEFAPKFAQLNDDVLCGPGRLNSLPGTGPWSR